MSLSRAQSRDEHLTRSHSLPRLRFHIRRNARTVSYFLLECAFLASAKKITLRKRELIKALPLLLFHPNFLLLFFQLPTLKPSTTCLVPKSPSLSTLCTAMLPSV